MPEPAFPYAAPPAMNSPVRQANSIASVDAPLADPTGITLPGPGIFLVSLVVKAQGSLDHSVWGTWLVYYSGNRAQTTLVAQLIGTVQKSAVTSFVTGITLSGPTADGVLTATTTRSAGGARPGSFDWSVTQIAAV